MSKASGRYDLPRVTVPPEAVGLLGTRETPERRMGGRPNFPAGFLASMKIGYKHLRLGGAVLAVAVILYGYWDMTRREHVFVHVCNCGYGDVTTVYGVSNMRSASFLEWFNTPGNDVNELFRSSSSPALDDLFTDLVALNTCERVELLERRPDSIYAVLSPRLNSGRIGVKAIYTLSSNCSCACDG